MERCTPVRRSGDFFVKTHGAGGSSPFLNSCLRGLHARSKKRAIGGF
jgi:hypothetical protein